MLLTPCINEYEQKSNSAIFIIEFLLSLIFDNIIFIRIMDLCLFA